MLEIGRHTHVKNWPVASYRDKAIVSIRTLFKVYSSPIDQSQFRDFAIGNFPKQLRSNSEPSYLVRRRSSSASSELELTLEHHLSSPTKSNPFEFPLSYKAGPPSPSQQNRVNVTKKRNSISNASHNKVGWHHSASLTKEPGDGNHHINADLPSNLFDKDGEIRNSRAFFKTPLVSGTAQDMHVHVFQMAMTCTPALHAVSIMIHNYMQDTLLSCSIYI